MQSDQTDEKRHFAYLGLYVQLGKLPPSVFLSDI